MVGFVLIVVLVTVIGLIFLAITLRKPVERLPSAEIDNLMQSAMRYSSDCYSSVERRYDIKDLIKACNKGELCLDGNSSCSVLNKTLTSLLDQSFRPGENNPVKYYGFNAIERVTNRTIMGLKNGKCTGTRAGSNLLITSEIAIDFEICS